MVTDPKILLVCDTGKGFVDGRILRLPTVAVRAFFLQGAVRSYDRSLTSDLMWSRQVLACLLPRPRVSFQEWSASL
mgnify:CR=1 FL=1